MNLSNITYPQFTLYLAERDISYVETKSFRGKTEIVMVVPRQKYKDRWFEVESGKQIYEI